MLRWGPTPILLVWSLSLGPSSAFVSQRDAPGLGLAYVRPKTATWASRQNDLLTAESLGLSPSSKVVDFVGEAQVTAASGKKVTCAVVSAVGDDDPRPALLMPLATPRHLAPLYRAMNATTPLSWVQLLSLNAIVVGRDDALFDNLPWSTWTTDVKHKEKDAAGNVVEARYHLGKRRAYNRMLGQDWRRPSKREDDLQQRLDALRNKELKSELADVEQRIAVAQPTVPQELLEQQRVLQNRIQGLNSEVPSFLGRFKRDKEETTNELSYEGPYHLLLSVIQEQLQAKVIGVALEQCSLLEGSTTIGGVIVLRRQGEARSVTLGDETLTYENETSDFGNPGVRTGTIEVVECDADEAIGMAQAASLPLRIEQKLWEQCCVMVGREGPLAWRTANSELTLLVEGQPRDQSSTERVLPVRFPRSTLNTFDTWFLPMDVQSSNQAVYGSAPSDRVDSLAEYDKLDDADKARLIWNLSPSNGRRQVLLPRPRTLRADASVLDDLLLLLVDESTRNHFLIRKARQAGDWEEVRRREESKSPLQRARERADALRDVDANDADRWDDEAAFLESLRADITQDEGAYSRFLDRDEWYERERQKNARRVDRKKFGTLLDGIE